MTPTSLLRSIVLLSVASLAAVEVGAQQTSPMEAVAALEEALVEVITLAQVEATYEDRLKLMVQELRSGLDLRAALVIRPTPQAYELRAAALEPGLDMYWEPSLSSDAGLDALRDQASPIIITDLDSEPWSQSRLFHALDATCAFHIPLQQEAARQQMVLLITSQSPCPFSEQDLWLYTSLLNQINAK